LEGASLGVINSWLVSRDDGDPGILFHFVYSGIFVNFPEVDVSLRDHPMCPGASAILDQLHFSRNSFGHRRRKFETSWNCVLSGSSSGPSFSHTHTHTHTYV